METLSSLLAEAWSSPPGGRVELIGAAAPCTTSARSGYPTILLKPGKLTAEEFEHLKTHSVTGAHILAGSSNPVLAAGRGDRLEP